jgi:hypothetical protein
MPRGELLPRPTVNAKLSRKLIRSCWHTTISKPSFSLLEKFTVFYSTNAYHKPEKISRKKFFYPGILILATDEHGAACGRSQRRVEGWKGGR